jgi:hypothetical protein
VKRAFYGCSMLQLGEAGLDRCGEKLNVLLLRDMKKGI